jgi:hypothetical protein
MTDVLLRPLVRLQIAATELREREDGLRSLFSTAASSVSNAPGG